MKKIISLAICIALLASMLAFGTFAFSTDIGDVNDSGDVTIDDAVLLAQYLSGWDVKIIDYASDCTGDGIVDVADAVILAQYLAKWKVTFGSDDPYRYLKDIDIPVDDVYYGEPD